MQGHDFTDYVLKEEGQSRSTRKIHEMESSTNNIVKKLSNMGTDRSYNNIDIIDQTGGQIGVTPVFGGILNKHNFDI